MPTRAPDTDQAWRLANEAVSTESHSRLEDWLIHWLMAFLYEWHDEDFSRSVAEARMAMQLAPYDPCSSSELSSVLANAEYEDEAVAGPRAEIRLLSRIRGLGALHASQIKKPGASHATHQSQSESMELPLFDAHSLPRNVGPLVAMSQL